MNGVNCMSIEHVHARRILVVAVLLLMFVLMPVQWHVLFLLLPELVLSFGQY